MILRKRLSDLFIVVLLLVGCNVLAQKQQKLGTNSNSIHSSAVLELESTTRGLLPPRMTHAQKTAISSPATGLIVLCTNCGIGEIQVYNGFEWINFSGAPAITPGCGASVAAGVYKEFACYNLGATNTTGDPNVPVQGIHGNYYQWGRSVMVATASTAETAISGWATVAADDNAWLDGIKRGNDSCPTGFRVPTRAQWIGVLANNTVSRTGSWANSSSNFTTAISFGPNASTKTLTLSAAGSRNYTDGSLVNRGNVGYYWSSTEGGADAWVLYFNSSSAYTSTYYRANGFSVRCVSE
jgi:uncharacterized protein (TIGR02145 family)